MVEQVTEYVGPFHICQHNKFIQHRKYPMLENSNVRMRSLTFISMHFIAVLPKSEGYTKIWVIEDRFTKMGNFLPQKTEEHIKEEALMLVKDIGHGYALPETIVSDRYTQFTSVTGLFLSNENTIVPAIDLLALVLREASRDRR